MPTVRHPPTSAEVNVNTLAPAGFASTGYDQPPPVAAPQPPKPQPPVVQTSAPMHPVPQPVPQPQANIAPQPSAQPQTVPIDVAPTDQPQPHAAAILNTPAAAVVSQQPLDYTNQTYSQNAIPQNLPNDSLFHSVEDGPAPHALIGQPVNDTTVSQFEIPAMAMPNQSQVGTPSQAMVTFFNVEIGFSE